MPGGGASAAAAAPEGERGCDEGFVSYYNALPPEVFPTVAPAGVPHRALPAVRDVTLKGKTLEMYDRKRWVPRADNDRVPRSGSDTRGYPGLIRRLFRFESRLLIGIRNRPKTLSIQDESRFRTGC